MKKHILAAAVATAIAAPAFAQSSVEIFGRLDVGYSDLSSRVKVSGIHDFDTEDAEDSLYSISGKYSRKSNDWGNSEGVGASGATGGLTASRLGFRGTEDLGGGMQAKFWIETDLRLNPNRTDTSNLSGFLNREAWVGLAGSFGEVRLGNQYTPSFNLNVATDPGLANQVVGGFGATSAFYAAASDNSIRYYSPSLNGVVLTAMMASDKVKGKFDGATDSEIKKTAQAFGATYTAGNLYLGFASTSTSEKGAAAFKISNLLVSGGDTGFSIDDFNNDDISDYIVDYSGLLSAGKRTTTTNSAGATYNFGVAKLFGYWFDRSQSTKGSLSKLKTPMSGYRLGVSVPVTGALNLVGVYNDVSGTSKFSDTDNDYYGKVKTTRSAYQVGGLYSFSKRTTVYALYGEQADQHKYSYTAYGTEAGTGKIKDDRKQFAFGVRHDF